MATRKKPAESVLPILNKPKRGTQRGAPCQTGLVKELPVKPTNPRMAKALEKQRIVAAFMEQAERDLKNPESAAKRKAKEELELAKYQALKTPLPRETFIPAMADEICARVAEGENLTDVLRSLGLKFVDMCAWLRKSPVFAAGFAVARENVAHLYVSQMVSIADGAVGKAEVERLQIQTRQWLASKVLNKLYGDKIVHAGDAENPLVTKLVMSASDLVAKIKSGEK